jgi:hypothetical protein
MPKTCKNFVKNTHGLIDSQEALKVQELDRGSRYSVCKQIDYTHTHTHTHIYIYIHTHTYTHTS